MSNHYLFLLENPNFWRGKDLMGRMKEIVATLPIFELCSKKGNTCPLCTNIFQYYKSMHDWWAFGAPFLPMSRIQLPYLPPILPSLIWFWNKRMRFSKHSMFPCPGTLIQSHTFKWFIFVMFPNVKMTHCILFFIQNLVCSVQSKNKLLDYQLMILWY